jgi:hypothetical protein
MDGPLGEPVEAVRVTPPQPKLSVGTLVVLDDAADDVGVLLDDAGVSVGEVVVPVDEVVPVDVLAVDVVSEDDVAVDAGAPLGEAAAEEPSPPHPITIKEEAAAAAAIRVERIVMEIGASFRSWRIPVEAHANSDLFDDRFAAAIISAVDILGNLSVTTDSAVSGGCA